MDRISPGSARPVDDLPDASRFRVARRARCCGLPPAPVPVEDAARGKDLRALREALALRLPGYDPGDSELEIRALRALHRAGLPTPIQQHVVRRPDGRLARIDLAYPSERIAIELDGWDHHGRRSRFDPDRIRRNELTLLGWDVYNFTATMDDNTLTSTVAAALHRTRTDATS